MKYALIVAGLALGLAMPALANDTSATKKQSANQAETMHAPTNRVGDAVPTMTSPENKNAANTEAQSGDKKAETVHAPTNRVGKQVPTMKSAENKDEQSTSKTYNNEKKSSTE